MSSIDKAVQTQLDNIQKRMQLHRRSDPKEVDSELVAWIKSAYESSG